MSPLAKPSPESMRVLRAKHKRARQITGQAKGMKSTSRDAEGSNAPAAAA